MNYLPNANRAIYLMVFAVFGTSLIVFSDSKKRSCSVSLKTALTTDHCPSGLADWQEREKLFNCTSFRQNCTLSSYFSYHWVPNAWRNACVEVCAIESLIVGKKCPEFNFGGQRVQEYNKGECKSCPFIYNSTDVHKYMECFNFAKVAPSQTDITRKNGPQYSTTAYEMESECSGFGCTSTIVGFSVAFLLGSTCITALIYVVYKRYSGRLEQKVPDLEFQGYSYKETEEAKEQTTPLNPSEKNTGKIPRTTLVDDALHNGHFSQDGHSPAITKQQETTNCPEDEPEYKAYSDYKTRLLSFSTFKLQDMKKNIAYAGFFYEGYKLATSCFQCGCSKDDWKIGDDAFLEHSNLNASCPFLRNIKKNNDLQITV